MMAGGACPTVLTSLLDAAISRCPAAPALDDGETRLSYAELGRRVASLAGRIAVRLPMREAVVGASLSRSSELVIAFLATLRAGGTWLPLDPAYPQERLAFMLADAQPALLLTGQAPPPAAGIEQIAVADDLPAPASLPAHPSPGELAYLLYTSGSTGQPKGVAVEHRGLVNLAQAQAALFGVAADSQVLQFASPNFDAFVSEVAMALCAAACLHVATREALLPGKSLAATLRRRAITHVTLPPAALAIMQPEDVAPGLAIIVAGEAVGAALVRRWAPGRRLINGYGPTEATVCATMGLCDPAEPGPPSIGAPLPNVRIVLGDATGLPVPEGEAGEILIGGIGLARGYWRRPELTAERFIDDPAGSGRLYRSGDLGRRRADGRFDFLGRVDDQLKIRGYRVEPGEIESVLAEHPAVGAVAVVAQGVGEARQLVACLVARAPLPLDAELRAFLLQRLPEWMVPARWARLDALPLSPNGKVDRARLPSLLAVADAETVEQAAPRDAVEQRVLSLIEELLGRRGLGVDADFFASGGDSLRAALLLDRIDRDFGRRLPLQAMAREPTALALARLLRTERGSERWSPLVPLSRGTAGATALLCVHPGGGTVLPYRALALALPAERPVFGLQAHGAEPGQPPDDSVEAMASRYAAAVQAELPPGPVALAGWSYGAFVALEAARLLVAAGRPVVQVIALDAALGFDPGNEGELDIVQRLIRLYGYLLDRAPAATGQAEGDRLAALVDGAIAAGIFPADFGVDQARRLAAITAACFRAGRAYRPQPWTGPLTLIRASTVGVAVDDETLGWRAVAPSLSLLWTAGSHLSMMRPPDVAALAQRIEAAIAGRPLASFRRPTAA